MGWGPQSARSSASFFNSFCLVTVFTVGCLTHYHDHLRANGETGGVLNWFFVPGRPSLGRSTATPSGLNGARQTLAAEAAEDGNAASGSEKRLFSAAFEIVTDDAEQRPDERPRRVADLRRRGLLSEVDDEAAEQAQQRDRLLGGVRPASVKIKGTTTSTRPHDERDQDQGGRSTRRLHGEHGEEALHGEARVWTVIVLFGLIIVMSIAFEEFQHHLIHHYKHTGQTQMLKMIDAMFKELTILGFVGLSLMCLVKSGALTVAAVTIFEHHHLEHHVAQHHEAESHGHVVHHHTVVSYEHGEQGDLEGGGAEAAAARRRLHGAFHDPIAEELFEMFEAVHMMIFFVMVAFIALVGCLLVQSSMTRAKFHLCQNLRAEHLPSLTFKQRLLGGPTILQDTIEFRLLQKEFFHPWDRKMQNPEAHPASFDFSDYLGVCMADFVVQLVEIPSVSFATLFLLLLGAKPAFRMERENQELFLNALAWTIAVLLGLGVLLLRNIYYELLPEYGNLKSLEDYMARETVGSTAKPKYQTKPFKRGTGNLTAWLCGTRAPNKQESLFPFWRNGPALIAFSLQISLFLQAIYIAVYWVYIFPHEEHQKWRAVVQFLPLLVSLTVLWPSVLYLYTIVTATGMMQQDDIKEQPIFLDMLVEEISRRVEAQQFKRYSILITELETSALVHQLLLMDNYLTTKVAVKGGHYEKWIAGKLSEFSMTVPRDQQHTIQEAFKTWDRDNSGAFDVAELTGLLQSQGRSHAAIESVLRQWLFSGIFRPRYDPKTGKLDDKEANVMYSDEFQVFVMLERELTGGDFDEDRLEGWLSSVLDKNGDGSVSTGEFLESLGDVCKAAGIDLAGVKRMFKIIQASEDENQEVEEIDIAKILIWLKKYAIQKRKDAEGKKRGFMMNEGEGGHGGGTHGDRASVHDEKMQSVQKSPPGAAKAKSGGGPPPGAAATNTTTGGGVKKL